MTAAPSRPLPVPDDISAPYWAAAARHQLVVARCSRCRAYTHPPDVVCQNCGRADPGFEWAEVSGRGAIRSWTVVRQSFLPGFDALVPYVLVEGELVVLAHLLLIGGLLAGPDAPLALGRAVTVAFEDLSPEISVPAFELAVADQ